ncbi:MAG TPA: methyltransferase domain-containing protein [Candidatus Binataceae bacterium]|nr:methyltransferase domain-containing protein [Candidatus Binataceae bacterium]
MIDQEKENIRRPSFGWRKPDRSAALEQYRRRARFYDLELALIEPIRRRAIERLALKAGDVVLDVGCGTGLSFELLRSRVGAQGKIIGIEQSAEMIGLARERAARNRWDNIELIQSPVEDAPIDLLADAALFHFTHDILRTRGAVGNVVSHLKPGALIVASGLKWARWGSPANLLVLQAALISVTSLEGLAEPWSNLVPVVGTIEVASMLGGGVFIATARTKE